VLVVTKAVSAGAQAAEARMTRNSVQSLSVIRDS
jgi:hypothetical protein